MARDRLAYNVLNVFIVGLIFHLVFIGSVFDCYFINHVVSGMEKYSTGYAASKRLVLIIGDGLRADLLFNVNGFPSISEAPPIVAPHLRFIMESRGAFGISHTRVPTESRPGHIAVIGGMYEYISSVAMGWKIDPADFDSVFNRSTFTFSFGSPEILSIFTRDATALDLWVLEELRVLFQNATLDTTLNAQLRSGKVVFFLHLLGLDMTGHSYRPHSKEYMNNIKVVDSIVQQIETVISEFYGDDETSYVFTADHGMSAIGNHGDGSPEHTRTPLIAWGRGIRGPVPDSSPSSHDSYSEPWKLGHLLRRDVDQADLASLMATLLGTDWPVNSVGVLPDADPSRVGYLDPLLSDELRARAALVNAKVILEHYRVKHELMQSRMISYKPFLPLEASSPCKHYEKSTNRIARVAEIEYLINENEWRAARMLSYELIRTGLDGLHYLQTYNCLMIRVIGTVAYAGWAAFLSLFIFRPLDTVPLRPSRVSHSITSVASAILSGFWILFYLQKSSRVLYMYIAFPIYFWQQFLVQAIPTLRARWKSNDRYTISYGRSLVTAVVIVGALRGMMAGYTYRFIWSLGLVFIGLIWPISWPKQVRKKYFSHAMAWAFLCLITGVFPLLSTEKEESLSSILAGGALMVSAGWLLAPSILRNVEKEKGRRSRQWLRSVFCLQIILILIMMVITLSSTLNLQKRLGLPQANQVGGWATLVFASSLPFVFHYLPHTVFSQSLLYFLGFGPCFVILSIGVEGLFYVTYSAMLVGWVVTESVVRRATRDSIRPEYAQYQLDDLRIALFFVFFIQVGFFGSGNVASLSSFYLEPLFRLIPIYSPFTAAVLLIFKIVAPFTALSAASAVLNGFLRLPPFSIILISLALTNGMTMIFFLQVNDTGSWSKIGQSISSFCISSLLLLWSTGICAVGEYLFADVMARERGIKKDL